jgi:hypothetical protein
MYKITAAQGPFVAAAAAAEPLVAVGAVRSSLLVVSQPTEAGLQQNNG